MPEDETNTTEQEEQAEEQETTPIEFDTWLAAQADEIRAAYEGHVAGLKSALQSEREQRKEHERAKRDAEKAREAEEAQKLAEQQKWQELATRREREVSDLKAELEQERLASLKLRVAQAKGLPAELVARLQGTSEDELGADADALLKLIKTNAPKETIPATPKPDNGVSQEDRRKQAWYARL